MANPDSHNKTQKRLWSQRSSTCSNVGSLPAPPSPHSPGLSRLARLESSSAFSAGRARHTPLPPEHLCPPWAPTHPSSVEVGVGAALRPVFPSCPDPMFKEHSVSQVALVEVSLGHSSQGLESASQLRGREEGEAGAHHVSLGVEWDEDDRQDSLAEDEPPQMTMQPLASVGPGVSGGLLLRAQGLPECGPDTRVSGGFLFEPAPRRLSHADWAGSCQSFGSFVDSPGTGWALHRAKDAGDVRSIMRPAHLVLGGMDSHADASPQVATTSPSLLHSLSSITKDIEPRDVDREPKNAAIVPPPLATLEAQAWPGPRPQPGCQQWQSVISGPSLPHGIQRMDSNSLHGSPSDGFLSQDGSALPRASPLSGCNPAGNCTGTSSRSLEGFLDIAALLDPVIPVSVPRGSAEQLDAAPMSLPRWQVPPQKACDCSPTAPGHGRDNRQEESYLGGSETGIQDEPLEQSWLSQDSSSAPLTCPTEHIPVVPPGVATCMGDDLDVSMKSLFQSRLKVEPPNSPQLIANRSRLLGSRLGTPLRRPNM